MSPESKLEFPPALAGIAVAISLLAMWALSFSHSCASDGCIGIIFPAGAAAALLAVQLLIAVPVFGYRCHQAGKTFLATSAFWAVISIAAFVLPIAFVK